MEKLLKKRKPLPRRARLLLGWAVVVCACAGLVYYWRVAFSLGGGLAWPLTLAAAGAGTLLYAAALVIARVKSPALRGAALVFLLGLLFCFGTAPLQAPDEHNHFLRANAISRGIFTYEYNEDTPADAALLSETFPPALAHRVQYQRAQLAAAGIEAYHARLAAGEGAEGQPGPNFVAMLLPYALQAVFMAVGRAFGLSALGLMYAGRLANLLLYSALCYVAFNNCKQRRGVFYAFALLPVSLFMAASCSYDGLALGLCFVAVSIVCKSRVETRDVVIFAVALALANYIKPLNFLLAFVLLLIPRERWELKLKPWVLCVAAAGVAVAFYFAMGRGLDEALMRGWPEAEDRPRGSGDGANQGGQFAFMLANPLRFAATALLSVYEGDGFLFDLGRLGWMDLALPLVGGLSVLSLCAAAVLSVRRREDAKTWALWALAAGALVYAAAVLAGMYVADTDYGSIRITGQQPRYFLPTFLMLFMVASALLGRLVRPRLAGEGGGLGSAGGEAEAPYEQAALWLAAAVALVAAVLLVQNYYVGQWIPRPEGGWVLVNLHGWQ